MLPDAELVALELLEQHAPTVTVLPPAFEPPMILVERVGGAPDLDDYTDRALVQVSFYGTTRPLAWELAGEGQTTILTAACTEVAGVLVESTAIAVGGQQVPDLDPDDRRVIVTVELALDLRPHFAGL